MKKLRREWSEELVVVSDNVIVNRKRIERLRDQLETVKSSSDTTKGSCHRNTIKIINFAWLLVNRLLGSAADLCGKLETYSAQMHDVINANSDFPGYQVYSEVNPTLNDTDVVSGSNAMQGSASMNTLQNIVVNTIDAFLFALNDVTSMLLDNEQVSSGVDKDEWSQRADDVIESESSLSRELESIKTIVARTTKKMERNSKEIRLLNVSVEIKY